MLVSSLNYDFKILIQALEVMSEDMPTLLIAFILKGIPFDLPASFDGLHGASEAS
jgi:hypothetical protein